MTLTITDATHARFGVHPLRMNTTGYAPRPHDRGMLAGLILRNAWHRLGVVLVAFSAVTEPDADMVVRWMADEIGRPRLCAAARRHAEWSINPGAVRKAIPKMATVREAARGC